MSNQRSPQLLHELGLTADSFVLVGSSYESFRGFETSSIPLKQFKGNENDNTLSLFLDYLQERIVPAFRDKRISEVLMEDFSAGLY